MDIIVFSVYVRYHRSVRREPEGHVLACLGWGSARPQIRSSCSDNNINYQTNQPHPSIYNYFELALELINYAEIAQSTI